MIGFYLSAHVKAYTSVNLCRPYSKALVVIYLFSAVFILPVSPCLPALGKDFHPPSPVSLCLASVLASRVRKLDQNHGQEVPHCSISLLVFFAVRSTSDAQISKPSFSAPGYNNKEQKLLMAAQESIDILLNTTLSSSLFKEQVEISVLVPQGRRQEHPTFFFDVMLSMLLSRTINNQGCWG